MAHTAECAAPEGNQGRDEWMTVIEMQEYMRTRRKDLRHALVDGGTAPLNQVRTDKGELRVAIASLLRRSILAFRNLEEAANLFQGRYQQQLHSAPLLCSPSAHAIRLLVAVTGYEAKLARADLPNIPFHSEPLMNGHKDYEFLNIEQRKVMLAYFSSFVRKLPISYITFVYRRSQFEDPARLMERMGRDISSAMIEHLGFFQSFDDVKVYYHNGQDIVKQALDRSVGKILSKGVVRRRKTSMTDYRLEQVADYLCTIELALVKYEAKENGETYNKFFGGIGTFKRNWLKQARSKQI